MRQITTQIRRVRFYKEGEGILAVFPDEKVNTVSGISNGCYAHCGQYGLSDRSYHYKLPKAMKPEYQALVDELTSVGYVLDILNEDW